MSDPNYESICHEGKTIAIILRRDFSQEKTTFFGEADFSQQLGYLRHQKGNIIQAHFHKKIHRDINFTQEVLFIRKGKLELNLYSPEQKFITSRILEKGDVVFLCSGAHGFKILQDTEMIEVKQGPYSGRDSDKECFPGIENDPC